MNPKIAPFITVHPFGVSLLFGLLEIGSWPCHSTGGSECRAGFVWSLRFRGNDKQEAPFG